MNIIPITQSYESSQNTYILHWEAAVICSPGQPLELGPSHMSPEMESWDDTVGARSTFPRDIWSASHMRWRKQNLGLLVSQSRPRAPSMNNARNLRDSSQHQRGYRTFQGWQGQGTGTSKPEALGRSPTCPSLRVILLPDTAAHIFKYAMPRIMQCTHTYYICLLIYIKSN